MFINNQLKLPKQANEIIDELDLMWQIDFPEYYSESKNYLNISHPYYYLQTKEESNQEVLIYVPYIHKLFVGKDFLNYANSNNDRSKGLQILMHLIKNKDKIY